MSILILFSIFTTINITLLLVSFTKSTYEVQAEEHIFLPILLPLTTGIFNAILLRCFCGYVDFYSDSIEVFFVLLFIFYILVSLAYLISKCADIAFKYFLNLTVHLVNSLSAPILIVSFVAANLQVIYPPRLPAAVFSCCNVEKNLVRLCFQFVQQLVYGG